MMERPPILRGSTQEQIAAIRDYLFRMAQSLDKAALAETADETAFTVKQDGTRVFGKSKTEQEIRTAAAELRDLIIKSAKEVTVYVDRKTEVYNEMYVAKSEFGTYQEDIQSTIENTARGVVESYNYASSIESLQEDIGLVQDYFTAVNGEIRRGIVAVPGTNPVEYVTGIAISQNLQFTGACGPADQNNPGDGYTYYYIDTGQTFGLYTSTGWQFWIDGYKKGWFDSQDGMLHVANIVVESTLQLGDSWQVKSSPDGSEFEISYIGG